MPGRTSPRKSSTSKSRSKRRALAPASTPTDANTKRRLLADLVKLLGGQILTPKTQPELPPLPPRTQQVLLELLKGKSEKEVATALGLSPHTVHVHVKTLYSKLNVSSRPELMAKCLGK